MLFSDHSAKKTHSERRKADGPLELGVEWKVMEPGECGSYPHLILAVSACIALCMSCCEASGKTNISYVRVSKLSIRNDHIGLKCHTLYHKLCCC